MKRKIGFVLALLAISSAANAKQVSVNITKDDLTTIYQRCDNDAPSPLLCAHSIVRYASGDYRSAAILARHFYAMDAVRLSLNEYSKSSTDFQKDIDIEFSSEGMKGGTATTNYSLRNSRLLTIVSSVKGDAGIVTYAPFLSKYSTDAGFLTWAAQAYYRSISEGSDLRYGDGLEQISLSMLYLDLSNRGARITDLVRAYKDELSNGFSIEYKRDRAGNLNGINIVDLTDK